MVIPVMDDRRGFDPSQLSYAHSHPLPSFSSAPSTGIPVLNSTFSSSSSGVAPISEPIEKGKNRDIDTTSSFGKSWAPDLDDFFLAELQDVWADSGALSPPVSSSLVGEMQFSAMEDFSTLPLPSFSIVDSRDSSPGSFSSSFFALAPGSSINRSVSFPQYQTSATQPSDARGSDVSRGVVNDPYLSGNYNFSSNRSSVS